MPALVTKRLRLIPVTLPMVEGVLRHDRAAAEAALDACLREHGVPEAELGATFPASWPNDDLVSRAFPFSLDAIRAAPEVRLWGDTMVLRRDTPRVVGSVVFRGRPENGIAEVGYGIEDTSRGLGLATEATRACVEWALVQPGVTAVRATTFPFHHASLGVIRKLGMQPCGTREHAMLGDLIVFERRS
jgi:ribosomal-protein-alanine N-acetyltransferase